MADNEHPEDLPEGTPAGGYPSPSEPPSPGPPPGQAPPPGYAPPAGYGTPPGYAVPAGQYAGTAYGPPPGFIAPPPPVRRMSTGKIVALVMSLVLGIPALLVAGVFVFGASVRDAFEQTSEVPRDSTGAVTESGRISAAELQPGDCLIDRSLLGLADDEVVAAGTVEVLPCAEPHIAEVYFEFDLAGTDYPGDDKVNRRAALGCARKFKTFVGLGYAPSELELYYYLPRDKSWKVLGDRKVTCMVSEETDTTVGSLKGVRR